LTIKIIFHEVECNSLRNKEIHGDYDVKFKLGSFWLTLLFKIVMNGYKTNRHGIGFKRTNK
jgi:hypothetical protein